MVGAVKLRRALLSVAVLNRHVAALDEAHFAQPFAEWSPNAAPGEPEKRYPTRLLRARRERPRRRDQPRDIVPAESSVASVATL